ncbi:NAD-dependent epimerase/dehydratase family protein [Jatrophihabitans endophyticus]|nr:NAD-dependent epimerase/dehydratase family protein [Jatrophihabitans endophyticus]
MRIVVTGASGNVGTALLLRLGATGEHELVADAVVAASVPHLVHQSSIGAYARGAKTPVTEDWPATGIGTSPYSVDKAAAERTVNRVEEHATVTRMRPALILQDAAASEIGRYFLGPLVPKALVGRRSLRLAPFSDALSVQLVHADDVAAALDLVLTTRSGGAFNVAADPVIDRAVFRRVLGGVGPVVPVPALRAVAAATWRLRLQPTDPGWVDLGSGTPLLDTGRLRALGWAPEHDAADVLGRFVDALHRGAGRPGPLLYRRGRDR